MKIVASIDDAKELQLLKKEQKAAREANHEVVNMTIRATGEGAFKKSKLSTEALDKDRAADGPLDASELPESCKLVVLRTYSSLLTKTYQTELHC